MAIEDSVLETPPVVVAAELQALRAALDDHVPGKALDRNLLIATWNLRNFASLTRKWTAGAGDNPKRDLRALLAITEIVSRFDIVAIQEVMGDLRALRHLLKTLGPAWGLIMTDITLGAAGNNERLAFVFDQRRVGLSGLAAELVVPPEWLGEIGPGALTRQFARTPYAVSFRAGRHTFILVTLHVDYGESAAERLPELRGIARFVADWATRSTRWHHDLIALGDFNIDRQDDPLWQAFTATGLTVPEPLHRVPRSIFSRPGETRLDKFYDQIAWFEGPAGVSRLSMRFVTAGGFDFVPYLYLHENISKVSLSFRLSDHYPLWAEFSLRE